MRPSTEQWRQLHGMSREIYGQPLEIWNHHDQPETREEASELLRKLHGFEPEEEEAMEETRVCVECDVEKPITDFRKFGRGRKKECLECDPFEKGDKTQSTGDAPEVQTDRTPFLDDVQGTDGLGYPTEGRAKPLPPSPLRWTVSPKTNHWCLSELRDPRLSVVRQAQKILDAKGLIDVSIEDTAEILSQIADLDLA